MQFVTVYEESKWQKVKEIKKSIDDPSGLKLMNDAERWAELMEDKISEGFELEEIMHSTARDVNANFGLHGTEYYYALTLLIRSWVYGKALKECIEMKLGEQR